MPKKKEKVQITLPLDLVEAIDANAKEEFLNRSSWFERATVFYLNSHKKEQPKKIKIDLGI